LTINYKKGYKNLKKLNLFGLVADLEGCIKAIDVSKFLNELKNGEEFTVYINSPGGSVFEGLAIYNLLSEYQSQMTIKVIGEASSIAAVIACAGGEDKTLIAETALMLVHKPWLFSIVDEDYIKKLEKELNIIKKAIIAAFKRKIGKSADELNNLMADGNYLTAADCVKYGFADSIYIPSEEESKQLEKSNQVKNELLRKYIIMNLKIDNNVLPNNLGDELMPKTLEEAIQELGKLEANNTALNFEITSKVSEIEQLKNKIIEKETAFTTIENLLDESKNQIDELTNQKNELQEQVFINEAKLFCEEMFKAQKLDRAEINGTADLSKDELPDKVKKLVTFRKASQELYDLEIKDIQNRKTNGMDYLKKPVNFDNQDTSN